MTDHHVWGTAPDFVGPRHALRERLLLDLFLSASPGKRVVDVGSGGGSLSRRLSELGFETTSTDASAEAVEVLRARRAGPVVHADATDLPFADDSFDGAVLGEVLEHVEDDAAALGEVARVLRPGGVLALSVPRNPAWFGPSDHWAGHVRRYTRERLLEPLGAAGFRVVRCTAWGFPLSALYHRLAYERHLSRHGPAQPTRRQRPALALLGLALQVDRLFVGAERGALGYLALAIRD